MITRMLRAAVGVVSDVRSRMKTFVAKERDQWHMWWYGLRGVGDLIASFTHLTRKPQLIGMPNKDGTPYLAWYQRLVLGLLKCCGIDVRIHAQCPTEEQRQEGWVLSWHRTQRSEARKWTIAGFFEWLLIDVLGWPTCGCPARQDRLNAAWPIHPPRLAIVFTHRDDRRAIWHVLQWFADEIRSSRMTRAWCSMVVVDQSPHTPTDPIVEVKEFHLDKPWKQNEHVRFVPAGVFEVTRPDGSKHGVAGPVWLYRSSMDAPVRASESRTDNPVRHPGGTGSASADGQDCPSYTYSYRRSQLADLCEEIRASGIDLHYVAQGPLGTAPARRLGTEIAAMKCRAQWVLMADCHVTCQRGRIAQILKFLRPAAQRESQRLYHGLLVNLAGAVIATHLKIWNLDGTPRVGSDGLWGTWDTNDKLAKLKGLPKSERIDSGGGWIMLGHINRLRDLWHPDQRGFHAPETFTSFRHAHTALVHPEQHHAGEVHVLGLLDFPHCFIRDTNPNYDHRPERSCWSHALECFALEANLQQFALQAGYADAWAMFRDHWIKFLPADKVDEIAADARATHERRVKRTLAGHRRNRRKPDQPSTAHGSPGGGVESDDAAATSEVTTADPPNLQDGSSEPTPTSVLPESTNSQSTDEGVHATRALPPVAAICATYGRPDCVRSLLAMWGQQTYQGEMCLIIVDTGKSFPSTSGEVNGRPFRVISSPERLTAGEAHNVALRDAMAHGFEHFVIMDDDDVYLPYYVAAHANAFAQGADWSCPRVSLAAHAPEPTTLLVEDIYRPDGSRKFVWHAAWGLSKRRLIEIGLYPDQYEAFDAHLMNRLLAGGVEPVDPWHSTASDSRHQYVYRVGIMAPNSSVAAEPGKTPDYTPPTPYREPLTAQLDDNAQTLIALLTSGPEAKAA